MKVLPATDGMALVPDLYGLKPVAHTQNSELRNQPGRRPRAYRALTISVKLSVSFMSYLLKLGLRRYPDFRDLASSNLRHGFSGHFEKVLTMFPDIFAK